MDKIIHCFLASQIRKHVEDLTGVEFNKLRFTYGNIKPDLFPSLIRTGHTIDRSLDLINLYAKNLLNPGQEWFLTPKRFFERLGIITHYLSDYFCFTHSYAYEGNLFSHWLYETSMIFKIRGFLKVCKKQLEDQILDSGLALHNFSDFLKKQYDQYTQAHENKLGDLIQSFTISCAFAVYAANWWKEQNIDSLALETELNPVHAASGGIMK